MDFNVCGCVVINLNAFGRACECACGYVVSGF